MPATWADPTATWADGGWAWDGSLVVEEVDTGLPTIVVETSLTTDPLDTPEWEDQTDYATSVTFRIGRDQQLAGQFQPGTAQVSFDNSDRRFDPNHAGGPNYGNLVPGKRLRISAEWASWERYLGQRNNRTANVLALGDSLTEGYGASTPDNRWVNVLQDSLRTLYPSTGIGSGGGYGFLPAYIGSAAYTPWTQSAGVTNDIGFGSILVGPGYRGVFIPAGDTDTATVTGTTVRIWHLVYGSLDPLEVRVDGVLTATVDLTGTLEFHDAYTDVPLGASGSHVVQVKGTGAGSYFDGAQILDGDEEVGIQIFDAAHAGYLSSSYGLGLHDVNAFVTDVADWVTNLDPVLTTIMLGTNDWFFSVVPATYETNLLALVEDVQAATASPVLIIASYTPSGSPTYAWSDYVDAMESVATATGSLFLNLTDYMPDVDTPSGVASGFYSDTLHPSDAGHAEIARIIATGSFMESEPFRLFGGFVDGWPQEYGFPFYGSSTVPVSDGLTMLNRTELGTSPFETVVESLNPVHWWKLDEAEGSSVAHDSGSAGLDGAVMGDAQSGMGDDGLDPSSGSTSLNNARDGYVLVAGADTSGASRAFLMSTATVGTEDQFVMHDTWMVSLLASTDPNAGKLVVQDSAGKARTTVRLDDSLPHMVVIVRDAPGSFTIYVDGASSTTAFVGVYLAAITPVLGAVGDNFSGVTPYSAEFLGRLQHIALFTEVLTAAQALNLYDASLGQFDADTSGERIERLLDLAEWPTDDRDIDTGSVTLEGVTDSEWNGTVFDTTKVIEASEAGAFYQEPDYRMRFRSRYAHLSAPRSTTSLYTFSDEDTDGVYHYEDIVFPEQSTYLFNRAKVSWLGGEEVLSDTDSIAAYGPREHSVTTVLPTAAQARSLAEWLIDHYSEPVLRVDSITLNPAADSRLWLPCLDLRIGDRVTVRKHPQEVGDPVEADLIVEGITGSIGDGIDEGTFTFTFSSADTRTYWIWDTSEWDTETRWA